VIHAESTTLKKRLKARIVSVRIPLGVNGQEYEMDVSRLIRSVEPREDRLAVLETGVHERHGVGRDVLPEGTRLQRSQYIASFCRLPSLRERISPG
jgi:hypothetical protein